MKKIFFILSLATLFLPSTKLEAQDHSNLKYGFTASIQNDQFGFLIPIWLSENVTLAPFLEFKYAEKVGTDFTLGLIPKLYLKIGKVMPYISFSIATLMNRPSSDNVLAGSKTNDWLAGAGFGGEYFIDTNFSFGIELQGNFTFSDKNSSRFGNPGGTNFNTAAVILASIYF